MPPVFAAIPAIAGAATAGIGLANAIKGPGDQEGVSLQQMIPDYQKMTQQQVASWVQKYINNYEPGKAYTGDLSAPATGMETEGLASLQKYLSGTGTGDLFDAAKQQTQDTIGGRYMDPSTNPYIQSMIKLSNLNLNDSITQARRGAGARGTYYTRNAITGENLLRERSNTSLDALIGSVLQSERERQFNAIPIAQTLDQYQNQTVPLANVGASQSYGSLSRSLQQADLERQYNEFKRKQTELSGVPSIGIGASATPQQYGLQNFNAPPGQSSLDSILGIVGKLNLGAMGGSGSIWDKLGGVFGGK